MYLYAGRWQVPGSDELPEGSRICQAIDAAGGMLDTASADWVNQAETAEDGQKIYVPSTENGDNAEGSADRSDAGDIIGRGTDGKVHLNAASREELMTLTGIGGEESRRHYPIPGI